ncbi:hypothetical protein O181_129770 [Austropuccinia psidii MF-1]|uniref:Uncharacterized protein n=1 Tax=Austropuccinia psidii MF-1 TaxID=1389203 RepID=A0A9Q3KXR1_9BASI|nr:hypothetical protein [Austropuccinia psidii MF-1]
MNSNLHIKSFLGQEKSIELLGGWSPLSCEDRVKNINNWLKNQSLLSIDQKKELKMTPALEEGPVVSTSSRNIQREAQRTSEEERSQETKGQGKRQRKLEQTLPTRVQDPQIGTFSCGKCLKYGQDASGIHSQRSGKDKQEHSTQTMKEIQFVKSTIDVELCKLYERSNEITLDISETKRNDKDYTEWYKFENVKIDSITNACDKIESKCKM